MTSRNIGSNLPFTWVRSSYHRLLFSTTIAEAFYFITVCRSAASIRQAREVALAEEVPEEGN